MPDRRRLTTKSAATIAVFASGALAIVAFVGIGWPALVLLTTLGRSEPVTQAESVGSILLMLGLPAAGWLLLKRDRATLALGAASVSGLISLFWLAVCLSETMGKR